MSLAFQKPRILVLSRRGPNDIPESPPFGQSLLKRVRSPRLVESTAFVEAVLTHTKEEAIECTDIGTLLQEHCDAERAFPVKSSFVL